MLRASSGRFPDRHHVDCLGATSILEYPTYFSGSRPRDHLGETRPSAGESTRQRVAEYNSVADLRGALTSEDAEIRSDAYQAVLEADVKPTDVLSDEPPEATLVSAGIVPERGGETPDTYGVLVEIRDILEAAHGGDSA